MESGELNTGKNALTSIAVAPGTAHHIAFGCDNGVAASQPAVLRVAIYDTGWHMHPGTSWSTGARGCMS